jgi:hypothetical protein
MIHIKRFLDKMAVVEAKLNKDLVLPIAEARGLRDDVAKLLADLHELNVARPIDNEVMQFEIKGGTFK